MPAARLTGEEIKRELASLPEWDLRGDKLCRQFLFGDFKEAFAFMTRVAEIAEAMDHHPEWRNVYNRVDVSLCTHDCGGITGLDFQLASAMEQARL